MTYAEATALFASLPLVPVRPASFPAPPPPRAKQAAAWRTCRPNRNGRLRCGTNAGTSARPTTTSGAGAGAAS